MALRRRVELPLRDHGAIGDGQRAALVASNGAIDWFAPGGLDGAPTCYSLLDDAKGGEVRFGPPRPDWTGTQTLANDEAPIVATRFDTPEGSFEVVDHLSNGRIVRALTVLRGNVEVLLSAQPALAFGPPRRVERWSNGVAFGGIRVEGCEPNVVEQLRAGEHRLVTISIEEGRGVTRTTTERHYPTWNEAVDERHRLQRAWRSDVGSVEGETPLRWAMLRSVRALRLLTVSTSRDSALLRALTTSVPARTGNERNIDERFAWLRDNAHAVRVWTRLDRRDWADQHRNWLADRAGDALPLGPAYTPAGDLPRSEEEISVPGWRGNGPVRVGARSPLDLGAIAELSLVLDDRQSWSQLERLGDWLAEHHAHAEAGRWDARSRPRRSIESALATRSALAALISTARRRNPLDLVTIGWSEALAALDAFLMDQGRFGVESSAGWRRVGAELADDTVDASILRWLAASELPDLKDDGDGEAVHRAKVTLDQAVAQLTEWPFTHRHLPHVDDGLPPGQGADMWASFTMVSALARADRWDEAHARMDALLGCLGPTHVGATHCDPMTGDLRGNLLAAPMHLALIDAALDLNRGPR